MPFIADAICYCQLVDPTGVVYGPDQIAKEPGVGGASKECRYPSEVVLAEAGVIVAEGAVGVLTSIGVDAVQVGIGLMLPVADVSDSLKPVRDFLGRRIDRKPTLAAGVLASRKGSAAWWSWPW